MKPKDILSEDTVISIGKDVPLSTYRLFFGVVDKHDTEYEEWLSRQVGKTLKEASSDYGKPFELRGIAELLTERRFDCISEPDKAFISAFDSGIGKLGYDYGGIIGEGYCWGRNMIIYSKTGVKSKKVAARIFIRDDGGIVLRLFFNDVDKHSAFIENAPEHIKSVFLHGRGDCGCNPPKEGCRMRKTYKIDGGTIEKCSGVVFEFWQPNLAKLPDYLALLNEFYAAKGRK